jgi:cytochrome c551/c552
MTIRSGISMVLGGFLLFSISMGMSAESPTGGERTFQAKGCGQCHALRGEAEKPGPPVERLRRNQSVGEFSALLWSHLPAMRLAAQQRAVTQPRMTAQDIGDLATYLGVRADSDPRPNLQRGQFLLLDRGCLKCHALADDGAAIGPDLSKYKSYDQPLAWVAAMWNHGVAMLDQATKRGIPFPVLSPRDMVDLLGYLSAYKETR